MIHTKTKIIGITGGIASGKSTVTEMIKDEGYKIIDADKIARALMKKDSPSYNKTVGYFGSEILDPNKEIDRGALGALVFSDKDKLKALNSITHPFIFQAIKEEIEDNLKERIIFIDIPLLFEEYSEIKKYEIDFDEIWLVYTDRERQIDRLKKRNNLTSDEAIKRIDSQMSMDLKRDKASRVILNQETIEDLGKEIKDLLGKI